MRVSWTVLAVTVLPCATFVAPITRSLAITSRGATPKISAQWSGGDDNYGDRGGYGGGRGGSDRGSGYGRGRDNAARGDRGYDGGGSDFSGGRGGSERRYNPDRGGGSDFGGGRGGSERRYNPDRGDRGYGGGGSDFGGGRSSYGGGGGGRGGDGYREQSYGRGGGDGRGGGSYREQSYGNGAGGGGYERKPGDWTCPACSANVFASKSSCFKCGEPKPGGGGGGGGGGRGGWDRDSASFDRRGGSFQSGPRGGGSGYVRRQGDADPVDVAAVEALLEERTMLRREHDFAAADDVRDRLTKEHGVTVYDRDNEWFVGGGFSRGGSGREGNERPGGGRLAPYVRAHGCGARGVDVDAVEALLEERSRMRERRMFNEADELRERLQAEHGVTVSDKDGEWRVAGGARSDGREPERRASRPSFDQGPGATVGPPDVGPMPAVMRAQTEYGILGHDYTRVAADATPLSADDFEPINGLLAARLVAKRQRRYDEADALKEMLADLGVAVDDNARMWRADGVAFDPKAWTRIAGDGDLAGATVPTGSNGVRPDDGNTGAPAASSDGTSVASATDTDRETTVAPGSSPSADELRALTVPQLKDLLREAGLKVGGKKDELVERLLEAQEAPATAVAAPADEAHEEGEGGAAVVEATLEVDTGLSTGGGGGASRGAGVDEAGIAALLEARGEAKYAKDYATADEITARLRADYSVVLDDKRRTWCVVVEFGGYYRVGPPVDPFTTKQVGDMLTKRTAHQELKEYEEADALHAQLTEMGIELNTRIGTWKKPGTREFRDRRAPPRPDRYQQRY